MKNDFFNDDEFWKGGCKRVLSLGFLIVCLNLLFLAACVGVVVMVLSIMGVL